MVLHGVKQFAKAVAHEYKEAQDRLQAQNDQQASQLVHGQGAIQGAQQHRPPPLPPRAEQQPVGNSNVQQASPPQKVSSQQPDNSSAATPSEEPWNRGSPTCPGFDKPLGTERYITPSIQDFGICKGCYSAHVASTCYSSRMNLVPNTNQGLFCTFSIRTVLEAWKEACLLADLPTATPEDQRDCLQRYKETQARVIGKIRDIADQRTVLDKEITEGRARYKAENEAAWRQVRHAAVMGAASSRLDNNVISSNVGGELGINRGENAVRIAHENSAKVQKSNDLLEEMRKLVV